MLYVGATRRKNKYIKADQNAEENQYILSRMPARSAGKIHISRDFGAKRREIFLRVSRISARSAENFFYA